MKKAWVIWRCLGRVLLVARFPRLGSLIQVQDPFADPLGRHLSAQREYEFGAKSQFGFQYCCYKSCKGRCAYFGL